MAGLVGACWTEGVIRGGCVTLGVTDFERAVQFYTQTLGLSLATRFGDEWAAIDAGGGLIIGLAARRPGEPPGGIVGMWTNEPLDVAVETLASRGIRFDGPIVSEGMVQLAFFVDPDGNHLSITNLPPSPTAALAGGSAEHRPLFDYLGLRWSELAPDRVCVEIDMRDDLRGPAGMLQGGIVATLVDVAAATAAAQGTGGLVATSEMTVHFLAPGRVGPIRASGEILRSRSGGAAVEVRVHDLGNANRLMAVALAAFSDLAGAARPPSTAET